MTVNALVVGALAIGFVNNIIIAAIFGLTRSVDAFFAASMLPTLFMSLCVDYLGKNFLPVLAAAKQESDASASTLTSSVVTIVALLATVVSALLVAFGGPLFAALLPGFDAAEIENVRRYFWIMAPAIVFMAINTFHEYVWQYDERFIYVSVSRIALPAANLLAILLLAPWLDEYCLAVGYVAGHAAVFVLLARRAPYRYRPSLAMRRSLERRVFANSAVVMGTGLIARTRSIVMNYLASTLGGGAISALALATKLTEPLERGAFAGARMVMFSHTARLYIERNERALGRLYSVGLRVSFLLLAPLLWWVALNSQEIVTAFFQRGQFTPQMAVLVAGTLVGLTPSVLFLGVNQLLSNAFYAMNRIKVPAIVMPFGTVVYVGAAVPLAAIFATQGLAMATTVTAAMTFATLYVCLARALPELGAWRTAVRLAAYGTLSGAVMLVTIGALDSFRLPPAAVTIVSLPLGAAIYCGALMAIGDRTYRRIIDFGRSCFEPPNGARAARQ